VGRAIPKLFFTIDLPAGNYEITATRNTKIVLPISLEAGEQKHVRVDMWLRQTQWMLTPVLVSKDTALHELRATTFTGQ
jgi:hypothetical protein